MDFKTFLVKKVMMSFFVSTTCITAAMALVGMIFDPATRFGYEVLLSPLLFGTVASLPMLVKYSRNELSLKQTVVRNVIHFVLLEVIILSILYFVGVLTTISMMVSLGVSIFVIDITVNLVLWVNDKKTAKEFNDALKTMQSNNNTNE